MDPIKTATITLDEKEAQNLIELINIACKAAGLPVAGVAHGWHTKLHLAFNPEPNPVTSIPESPK